MKYIIIHGGVITEGNKVLKIGDPIELPAEEAKKMGGEECFMEAAKWEALQKAKAASNAELAKAGIKPESAKGAEKGGK